MDGQKPRRATGGTAVLLMLLLALVIGILAFIGWRSATTHAPTPTATANPKVLPAAHAGAPAPVR